MSIDIKTAALEPSRHTFGHVARRLGADKPASRYLEATYDLQCTTIFHYRPLWDPQHEIYDPRRTAIVMADWYAFLDPRQYYYATWIQTRARQQEVMESHFAFAEKHRLLEMLDASQQQRITQLLVPLRHVEYGANLNNCYITAFGYGAALTQASMFATIDRLGIAQYLSRLGLALDGNTGSSLDAAKTMWTQAPAWQPLRRLVEDLWVIEDWFELFVAQNLALDGLLYPLVYERLAAIFSREHGPVLAMLTGFMGEWYAEATRWVDAMLKTAVAEADGNRRQLEDWLEQWGARAREALLPLAEQAFADDAPEVMQELHQSLTARAARLGIVPHQEPT
ncbi:aromatic/alkene monooxygenase hydroxylase subunit beta [Aerosticca soli]|uniref:Phenol hydroxylase, P1 oxygenase component DmpL n=1 Tax=Aerosticca soli TaxID=2010829 RepID=A0A2Z6E3C9_9GAMM|nr:aromatic/alkene monooxygenase hydroxylase subunit beta [Aerosticca soli]MDI3261972.1 aromatic/alkene monooxygenase hydroxylase subunit beta [Fulvimonas sp.]BBD79565.1 phenol hydroxylase, P1 oxygenase component DmpL [Aerosticca soli]